MPSRQSTRDTRLPGPFNVQFNLAACALATGLLLAASSAATAQTTSPSQPTQPVDSAKPSAPPPAAKQEPGSRLPAVGSADRTELLDDLHARLKQATTQQQGIRLERDIWSIWLHHGDPDIDKLMTRLMTARRESNFDRAIGLANQIIERAPDYAEGWNQRATLYFLKESYEESLRDVAEVLAREPRHFGALAGRGIIRMRQGKPALAIQNILEALRVNPHLRERQLLRALGYNQVDT